MFGKKKESTENMTVVKEIESQDKIIHDSPHICLFNFEESIKKKLEDSSYNCSECSLGKLVRVPNVSKHKEHLLRLNYLFPKNIHECDILVFNMNCTEEVDYDINENIYDGVTGQKTYALLSQFPETIFNPKPYSTQIISKEIKGILDKESIVIIFADENHVVNYQQVEINSYQNKIVNEFKISNTCFYNRFPNCTNKSGQKMKTTGNLENLSSMLLKYSEESSYRLIFNHPFVWDVSTQVKDESFIPLLLNNDNEIVSFVHSPSKGAVFVFPCIKNKKEFLLELFNNYLSDIFPNLFPFHGQFGWLDNGGYLLPGEAELLDERRRIEERYIKDVDTNAKFIEDLKEEFKFLRDIISKSGDELVSAVEYYLKWLGL